MTQPLSQRLEEMLASVRGRPITVADKAELLMLLSEAAQLAERVEGAQTAVVRVVNSPGHGGGYENYAIGNDYDPGNPMKQLVGKRVALVTLEEQ